MKKLILAVVLVGVILIPQAYAQPQGDPGGPQQGPVMQQKGVMGGHQGMAMGEGQMPMCRSMMRGMMDHGMMMNDVLQAMKEMLAIQEKIIKGVKPADKQALLEQLFRVQGRVDQMMSGAKQTMMHGMPGTMPEGAPSKAAPASAPHH